MLHPVKLTVTVAVPPWIFLGGSVGFWVLGAARARSFLRVQEKKGPSFYTDDTNVVNHVLYPN
jgi:hypothetical protein